MTFMEWLAVITGFGVGFIVLAVWWSYRFKYPLFPWRR